ncbi:uncharacterized protein LOC143290437 [Babylonia areolata]|uniref:uncharacterized protein LOC143290437 n=1 Tax=Babylonia areolata TaxID=304850 RepID=UPI003FD1E388
MPKVQPSVQQPDMRTWEDRRKYLTPLSFFLLFFTQDLVQRLCNYTNEYARLHGHERRSLYSGWTDVTPEDVYSFLALLMYMADVQVPNVECYWFAAPLLHGLRARRIARVNSYILFCDWRKNQDMKELKRLAGYGQLDFTLELFKEMGGIGADEKICHLGLCVQYPHFAIPVPRVCSRRAIYFLTSLGQSGASGLEPE